MKKTIFGLSGLVVLVFFIMFAVTAQNNDKKVEKINTEISQNFLQNPSIGMDSCCSASKVANCCQTKSGHVNCEASKCIENKCDPLTCQGGQCISLSCKTNCQRTSISMVGRPMNCNR